MAPDALIIKGQIGAKEIEDEEKKTQNLME